MENIVLKVSMRQETGKANSDLRNQDILPGVVYGHGFKTLSLSLPYSEFEKVFRKVGESSLFDLAIDGGETFKVIIADIQKDSVTDKFIHVDFHKVRMDEKITAEIPLHFIGEAPAVKELGGVLVKALDSLEISALPTDLIDSIEVDLSSLKTFDDVIRVKDLSVGDKIEIGQEPEAAIALVEQPRAEVEETPTESAEEKLAEVEKSESAEEKSAEGEKTNK